MLQWQTTSALQRTFPDNSHAQFFHPELATYIPVTLLVAADLGPPELFTGFRPTKKRTIMAVPEATMDEDCRIIFRQNQIRLPGPTLHMKPVPEPPRMQGLTNGHFRTCIRSPDRCHVTAAGCFVMYVSQSDGAAIFLSAHRCVAA